MGGLNGGFGAVNGAEGGFAGGKGLGGVKGFAELRPEITAPQ